MNDIRFIIGWAIFFSIIGGIISDNLLFRMRHNLAHSKYLKKREKARKERELYSPKWRK